MARKQNAQPCALKSCGRTVSLTHPDYPYCPYHKALKTAMPRLGSPESGWSMDEVRELLYAPKDAGTPRIISTLNAITGSLNPKLTRTVINPAFSTWAKATKDIDISQPSVSSQHRDDIIDKVRKQMEKTGKVTTTTATCHDGFAVSPRGGNFPINDHRIIIAHDIDTGDDIIIDVATTAPLLGNEEEMNAMDSGESTMKDNFLAVYMFEYAEYASSDYQTIINEDTGDVLWKKQVGTPESSETIAQREAIRKYGHPNPEGVTSVRSTDPQPEKNWDDGDLSLDDMIDNERYNNESR